MNITNRCILCSKESTMYFISKLRDDDTRFAYRCESCGHIQVSPLPSAKDDLEFYKSNEMERELVSKDEMSDEELRLKYQPCGIKQAEKIKHILNLSKDEKILDIGSGYGSFVEAIQGGGGVY